MKTRLHQTLLSFLSFLTKTIVTVAILATTVYAGTEYFDIDTNKIIQTATVKIFGNLYTSGSVGIGTDTPGEKLEVNGNIKLSGVTPSYRITNVANPIDNYDASNKMYVDTRVGAAGSQVANSYLSNGSYYSEGGTPYFCRLNVLNGTNQQIISVNQNQLCDATNNLFCSGGSCTATQGDVDIAKGSGTFLSSRDNRSCSITNGGAYCWGSTKYNQKYLETAVVGSQRSCVLRQDGNIYCWGTNSYGQNIGDGTFSLTTFPTKVQGLGGTVLDFAIDSQVTCAVLTNGTIKCIGYNYYGQLGNGNNTNSYTPVLVSGISNAVSISAMPNNSSFCAVLADGTAKCWGYNNYGQLGNGNTAEQWTPATVTGVTNALKVVPGSSFRCALIADGTIKCWGYNNSGQLGNSGTTQSNVPVNVVGINTAVDLQLSGDHACALLSDRTMKCWGYNTHAQVGNGNTTQQSVPQTVTGVTNVVRMSVNGMTPCAVIADGTIKCWGYNAYGQVGINSTSSPITIPSTVIGITNAVDVYAPPDNGSNTCAILGDGTVKCWGISYHGIVGDPLMNCGSSTYQLVPNNPVFGVTNAKQIFGSYYHMCTTLGDGTIRCWGNGGNGCSGSYYAANGGPAITNALLGNPSSDSSIASQAVSNNGSLYHQGVSLPSPDVGSPQQVLTIYSATNIATGNSHTCTIESGTVKCWGSNAAGQLGNGSTTNSPTPVNASIGGMPLRIAAGYMHTCVVFSGGTVGCWGDGSYGQLGNGSLSSSTISVTASGITTATDIAAADSTTCALLANGTVSCWGLNTMGQAGIGNRTPLVGTPTAVVSLTGAVRLIGGQSHFCAVLSNATVKCWGNGQDGQLGNGYIVQGVVTPQTVSGATNAARIGAGGSHTCVVKTDGTVSCWGLNAFGQLGSNLYVRNFTPSAALGISGMLDVSLGSNNTCVIKSDLTGVTCFGSNLTGESGAGTSAASSNTALSFVNNSASVGTASNLQMAMCETRTNTNGNLGGISGADSTCQIDCGIGYKFARESEIANFPGAAATFSTYWIDSLGTYNCSNWTSPSASVYGIFVRFGGGNNANNSYNGGTQNVIQSSFYNSAPCNGTRPILCIRGVR